MQKKKSFFTEALVAGSGSNYLLLTGQQKDELEFKHIDIRIYQMTDLSMGGMFCLALGDDQRLQIWGILNKRTIKLPQLISLSKITKIGCGWDHALVLDEANILFGLGRNKQKQLVQTKQEYYENLIKIDKNIQAKFVKCGFRQSYISDGVKIIGKGDNKNKELGNKEFKQDGWIQIGEVDEVRKIECGKKFMAVLASNGNLYACGGNQHGVLGVNKQQLPKLEMINQKVDDFAVGWNHLVLIKNNSIQSYGRNNFGQLGREQKQDQKQVKIDEKTIFQKVENLVCGTEFTFVTVDDRVYGWGWNEHSNISSNKQQIIPRPLQISTPFKPENIITYGACTLLLK